MLAVSGGQLVLLGEIRNGGVRIKEYGDNEPTAHAHTEKRTILSPHALSQFDCDPVVRL